MKKDIHPQYYKDAKITCACGASFSVGSTEQNIHVEICSMCHPFYTGKEKLLDTAGRVDKFKKRMAAAELHKKTEELHKNVSPLKDSVENTAKTDDSPTQNNMKDETVEPAADNK